MEKETLIKAAKAISTNKNSYSLLPEAQEFIRTYAGEKSGFYKQIEKVNPSWSNDSINAYVQGILTGFVNYIEKDLHNGMPIERKAQIDVVSDFLEQAMDLLSRKEVHPAAPAVLIGASLEEFLRNWIESENLKLGQSKPSIDTYAKVLKETDLISKQDFKDITSWAGLRNHAAHGEWEHVSDKTRITLMLEGINLFLRKYTK